MLSIRCASLKGEYQRKQNSLFAIQKNPHFPINTANSLFPPINHYFAHFKVKINTSKSHTGRKLKQSVCLFLKELFLIEKLIAIDERKKKKKKKNSCFRLHGSRTPLSPNVDWRLARGIRMVSGLNAVSPPPPFQYFF
ncbi:hypothetical protein CEXT_163851 [Caerostris extrusa]|uniref:Uncharacterized protein n=1 Tax=Caerostris extrusa TaxID=172846 RepID=A0AAV4U8M8_CAEEX|nr:hypothetical protein CEXT_163851 [Caerostris extrusa]